MAQVKQVRVWRNLIGLGLLCAALIWWLGDRPGKAPHALAWGVGLAVPGALLHWRWLARRITRRDRRYERNKIPVTYLSVIEALTELGDDSLRAEFLPMVASRWAHNDPESALDWATTLERGTLRDKVLANIAGPAMDFDVGLAVDVIDEIDDAELRANPARNLLLVIESDAEAIRRGKAYG